MRAGIAYMWRKIGLVAVAAVVIAAAVTDADARRFGGRSIGSRGERTHEAPPSTSTAPGYVRPMDRSLSDLPRAVPTPSASLASAPTTAASASGTGFVHSLFLGGLIGSSIARITGPGAMSSMFGFLIQSVLIILLINLAFTALRRKRSGDPDAALEAAVATHARAQRRPAIAPQRAQFGTRSVRARTA